MSDFVPDLDTVIGENLRILTRAVNDIYQRSTLDEAAGGELTATQFSILRILARRPDDLAAKEFAHLLDISPAAVSKNLDRLSDLGHVARDPDPNDRRSATLVLQPSGRKILRHYDEISSARMADILAHFSTEEKVQFLDSIRRIIRYAVPRRPGESAAATAVVRSDSSSGLTR